MVIITLSLACNCLVFAISAICMSCGYRVHADMLLNKEVLY